VHLIIFNHVQKGKKPEGPEADFASTKNLITVTIFEDKNVYISRSSFLYLIHVNLSFRLRIIEA